MDPPPARARPAFALAAGAVAALAALLLLTPELGSLGGDNAEYVLLAKSLAAGDGYRSPWAPGETGLHTLYPPVWPLLLSPFVGGAPGSFLGAHVPLVAAAFAAAFLLCRLFERRGLPSWMAATAAAAPLLSAYALRCTVDLLSEMPFLALAAGALLALEPDGRDAPLPPRRIAAGAACAALAFLTRTAGLALVIPVVLSLSLDRRTRGPRGWIAAASVAAAAGGWFLYASMNGGGPGYGGQLGAGEGIGALASRTWSQLEAVYLPLTPAYLFPHGGPAFRIAGFLLWGLGLAAIGTGFLRRRTGALAESFFLLYLGMQAAWPFVDPRFALPLAALLPGFAAEGLTRLADRRFPAARTAALGLLAGLLLLPNLAAFATHVHPRAHRPRPASPGAHLPAAFADTWAWRDAEYIAAGTTRSSFLHACDVIRLGEGVFPPGPVMAANPRVAALLTGRRAVQPPRGGTAAETAAAARGAGVALVLVEEFEGPCSDALRAWCSSGGRDLVEVLALPGGVRVMRVVPKM